MLNNMTSSQLTVLVFGGAILFCAFLSLIGIIALLMKKSNNQNNHYGTGPGQVIHVAYVPGQPAPAATVAQPNQPGNQYHYHNQFAPAAGQPAQPVTQQPTPAAAGQQVVVQPVTATPVQPAPVAAQPAAPVNPAAAQVNCGCGQPFTPNNPRHTRCQVCQRAWAATQQPVAAQPVQPVAATPVQPAPVAAQPAAPVNPAAAHLAAINAGTIPAPGAATP